MNKILLATGLAVALGVGIPAETWAQGKPETMVKQREAAMTLMAKYWGPLGGMARGKVPYNANVVARNAGYLEVLSKMPWDGFAASTKGAKSHALPAVWNDAAGFKAAQDKLQTEMAKLASVAKGGDDEAIKAQLKAASTTCGGCHKHFREKH